MSSKEIRAALKAAKTAIQAKDFDTALQQCDVILDKDKENYNALVFAGLCHSETKQCDRAREKYREAISAQPDQILAYQGLANLYIKHWKQKKTKDDVLEFVNVCEKVLSTTDRNDHKKRSEQCLNLCGAQIEAGNFIEALESISVELKTSENAEAHQNLAMREAVFNVLSKATALSNFDKYCHLVDDSFEHLMGGISDKTVSHIGTYVKYLRSNLHLFSERISKILDVCADMGTKVSCAKLCLEILVQAYVQNYQHSSVDDIESTLRKATELGSNVAQIGTGHMCFKSSRFEDAHSTLKSALPNLPEFLPGWVTLCKSALGLNKFSEAKNFAKRGLTEYKLISNGTKSLWLLPLMSLDDARFELRKCLAMSLCGSHSTGDVSDGIETFEKLLCLQPEDVDLQIGVARGLVRLERNEEAASALQRVLKSQPNNTDASAWLGYITFKTRDAAEGISKLESITPKSSLSLHLLGKCMWEAGGEYRKDKKNCFTALVKAAKLDPHRGDTFLLLGHFYSKVQRDTLRAKGCYQKAHDLDPTDQEAAASLADAFVLEGDTSSAIQIYEEITKKAGSASGKWAWLRLGLYKLKAKDMTNAIQCFQSALRIDSKDSICWECLGEGYLQRGSFTAAWKAFDRAQQLNCQSVYSLYQMARVKQMQGLYRDAIDEYAQVLEMFPDYVPSLQGLGESELLLARQMFFDGRFQAGIEHSEKAIGHLTTACSLRKDLSCLWKLLGDCCVLVHSIGASVVSVAVPSVLLGQKQEDDAGGMTTVGKIELLSLSVRFYCRAVQLQPQNPLLWHDLGVCYFRQAECSQSTEKHDGVAFAVRAIDAIKKALTLEPSNHLFWCSLGVVAASPLVDVPGLAQHCFLSSIKNEKNNVQAWSNLATLYLAHDHVKLAHEAFKVAQSLDPSFTNSWVGQAIIAEAIGSDETMDLYRHSTELGLQKQGASGYCSWVADLMADSSNRKSGVFKENIRDMNAVAMATMLMSKLSSRNPACAWHSTLQGFLLEYSGLNESAEKAYQRAYDCFLKVKNEGNDEQNDRNRNAAMNLARALCKNGRNEMAISLYNEHAGNLSVHNVCGLALALYKSGLYGKALESYEQAAHLAVAEDDKAQIMVAMAMTCWRMGRHDEAKTLLYQCFQSCKPGLQALLSLGVSLQDKTLIGAAVGEVMKRFLQNKSEKDVADDCLLVATAARACGDLKTCLSETQKALHRYPFSSPLRVLLCRLLVELKGSRGLPSVPMISNIANKLFTQKSTSDPLHRDSELFQAAERHREELEVAKCCALASVFAGSSKMKLNFYARAQDRLCRAQKFCRMHPYDPSAWRLLSTAIHAKDVVSWIRGEKLAGSKLTSSVAEHSLQLDSNGGKEQTDWVQNIKCWSLAINSMPTELQTSASGRADARFITLLSTAAKTQNKAILQTIFKEITAILGTTSDPAQSSKHFAELLERMKMFQVSKKMLEKSIALSSDNEFETLSLHFRLLQLMYNTVVKDEGKSAGLEAAVKSAIAEIMKLDAKTPHSLLFQGLASRMDKNHRKAKSFLNRVLNSTELVSDRTRSVAVWYLYRTLHERNDSTEIEKLVEKALEANDEHVARIVELLPVS